jgi:integrase
MNDNTALIPVDPAQLATVSAGGLAALAAAADRAARRRLFDDYRERQTAATLQAQDGDLATFARFLEEAGGVAVGELAADAEAWRGLTWGLVSAFVRWQFQQGYAIGTINRRLSTVKRYAELASLSGAITPNEAALIKTVAGYRGKTARNLDSHRETTRKGHKKGDWRVLGRDQVEQLKRGQPETPQGRRDTLLMCLLLDHGLRVSEIADLTVGALDTRRGTFRFYRRKVDKTQLHELTADTLRAAIAYLEHDAPKDADASLLRGSRKGGELTGVMSVRAMHERVKVLGASVGVDDLGPHDCRHTWATFADQAGTGTRQLQEAGGWASPAMPLRYAAAGQVANKGVRLE